MKTRSSFETKVLAAFTVAVLVVAGLATTIWKVAQGAEAARWVAHTHRDTAPDRRTHALAALALPVDVLARGGQRTVDGQLR